MSIRLDITSLYLRSQSRAYARTHAQARARVHKV